MNYSPTIMSYILCFFTRAVQLILLLVLMSGTVMATEFRSVSGTVTNQNGDPLKDANVALYTASDTLLIRGTSTSKEGEFLLRRIPEGNYHLVVSYVGYQTDMIALEISDQDMEELTIRIHEQTVEMDGAVITARVDPMVISGDTTIFNAAAFPVRSDAVAEDLIRRMPGFTVQNGRVYAQGEEVEQVLVDGEEFFGDDPGIAFRNLPAEIIRQIQVFDQTSEQAEFTGFDDGETLRTVNIITRGGIVEGQFGRANASLGTDDRYLGGGNLNYFEGARRVTVLGLSNNINQVNFSSDYLAGVAQASQATSSRGRGGGGGASRSGGGGGRDGSSGRSGDWGSPDNTGDFLMDEKQGLNTIHSFGINYIDRWNESWRISSSYFFNTTANTNDRILERQFLEDGDIEEFYNEKSWSESDNYNHRLNARIEYIIDPLRSVIIRPRLNLRTDQSSQELSGRTFSDPGNLLNEMTYSYDSENLRYDLANSMLYRRRFETRGRTFSVHVQANMDNRTGDQLQIGESRYYDEVERFLMDNQNIDILTGNQSVNANFQYTEPLSERSQFLIGYRPGIDYSRSERNVFRPDEETEKYDILVPRLTSRYENYEISHMPSVGYRLRGEGYHFNTSFTWQHTTIEGEQVYPQVSETGRTFSAFLPRAMLRYRFSDVTSLRLMYHARTRTPSVVQLQDVIDNTNPLLLTGGNPDLKQQYIHRLSARYRSVNPDKQTSVLGFLNISYTMDYIGNRTYQPQQDTLIHEDIVLVRGGRLVIPDHTGNSWDIRTFLNYSMPVGFLRSNVNLNTTVRYRLLPAVINDERNMGHNTGFDTGIILNSTISREWDFSLSYNAGYNFVRNTIREDLDDDYYTGRAEFRIHAIPWQWLVVATDFNVLHYHGLSDEFNRDIYFWNASIGYRFLQNRAAELKFTVMDILGQNSSINRVVTDMYIQDVQSEVLTRYFMITLSYNFRAFREGRR